jgi:hypothetical protein
MIKLLLNKKYYSVPTKWNELTAKQLVKIISIFEKPGEVTEARMKLLQIITGISMWRWIFVSADELNDALYLTDFLIGENSLTKNHLSNYKGFAGPADDFENLLMCEFAYTEDYFLRYRAAFPLQGEPKGAGVDLLNQLVAVLYRKTKRGYNKAINKDGDARAEFNEYVCKYHAKRSIASWPLNVKLAIAHWYDGCRTKLVNDYAEVFSGGEGEPAKYGLVSIMRNVAEKGVHGNFKDVEKLHVRMVMLELDEMMSEARKLQTVN